MAYWLLKTEPGEFSIDDLAAINGKTEPWDGIRNYQARNMMRDQIQLNDLAFIYHSSCKAVGVAGIAKVAQTAYPDPAQFNPQSRYFDPKARTDNPRWYCIEVSFVKRFEQLVTLSTIKKTPELSDMVLVKQGRLSIQPVTSKQWAVICNLSEPG